MAASPMQLRVRATHVTHLVHARLNCVPVLAGLGKCLKHVPCVVMSGVMHGARAAYAAWHKSKAMCSMSPLMLICVGHTAILWCMYQLMVDKWSAIGYSACCAV